ncbi:MAG: MerR family transcriptional regulator [Nitrospiraceae bacterium]|nr:MerR family transcriptional regulator [Nitrospiraceae bacterium]
MESMTIGKVARFAEVGVETVRFYEREGLIAEPPRRESGYRQYPVETVSRIRFIKHAKELGFTLKEIRELLSLQIDSEATCDDVRKRAEAKILDIEEKLQALERMKMALINLVKSCRGRAPVSECPILEAMEDGNDGIRRVDI